MPNNDELWNILTPFMGGPQTPPQPSFYSPMEQAALSPVFGMTPDSLQRLQNWSQQQAGIQTGMGDLAAAAVPESWGFFPKALADTASAIYGVFEPSRSSDLYNQMLWNSLNDTMARRTYTQSRGTPFQGLF